MLGVAVIGAGNVSTEHIRAYQQSPSTHVVAIGSRTLEGAEEKRRELGLECEVYEDLEAMLGRDDVDIVSICSPHEHHAAQTILAARAGKHILIEKPVAVNVEELRAMAEAVQSAGVRTLVSFVLRWNPMVANIKGLIDQGQLGDLLFVNTDYWHGRSHLPGYPRKQGVKRMPVSTFLAGACHAVDMARYLAGSDITAVSALSPDKAGDPPKTTIAIAQFANGVTGKISGSNQMFMPYVFNIEVFGTDGVARKDTFYARSYPGMESFGTMPTTRPDSGSVSHHPFQGEVDHFISCIQEGKESHCNLRDALNTHEACFAADLSAARGGELIRLPL